MIMVIGHLAFVSGRIFPDRVLSGGYVARARLGRSCGSSQGVPATPPARRQAREQPLVTSKLDLLGHNSTSQGDFYTSFLFFRARHSSEPKRTTSCHSFEAPLSSKHTNNSWRLNAFPAAALSLPYCSPALLPEPFRIATESKKHAV